MNPIFKAWSKIDNAWKIFLIIFIVNILQSLFNPLLWDEPYYWVWAKQLSWGYYDHPPMAAFLIRLGTSIFPGVLGVRFFHLLLGSFTYFLIYRIIEHETDKPVNFKLIFLLLFSSFFLNLYSFLACPDTPMVFFATLFIYSYRRYLSADTMLNTLLMGLVTALLLYSKYQGVLIIGFTVASNIKLFTRKSFYMVMVITIILFIPHIYWQIQNDYPTIRFHLYERARLDTWHDYVYLPKQLIYTGPVILLLFSILYKPLNKLQRALKFNVIGIFFFFFLSSFHEFVYTHWTAIAWPPMICLAYFYIENLKKYRLYINLLLLANLGLVIILRLDFVFDVFKVSSFNDENPQLMTSMITAKSKGNPVVFLNMYNEPSFYMYYSRKNTYSTSDFNYKRTQYNYLPQLENEVQGKTVCLVSDTTLNSSSEKLIVPKGEELYITIIPKFASFNTTVKVDAPGFKYLNAGIENTVKISVDSKLNSAGLNLLKLKGAYIAFNMLNKHTGQEFTYRYNKPVDFTSKGTLDFTFTAPAGKGNYMCNFSVMTSDSFSAAFNSNIYIIKVK
jgi:hypothetical protein